jgi:hypothetical protein
MKHIEISCIDDEFFDKISMPNELELKLRECDNSVDIRYKYLELLAFKFIKYLWNLHVVFELVIMDVVHVLVVIVGQVVQDAFVY